MAQAVETDLRPAAGVRFTTHRPLEEHFAAALPSPNALLAKAQRLTYEVFDDCDLHVRIERYGRPMTSTVWSSTGDAGISSGRRPDGVALADLRDLLEEYVADVVAYLAADRTLCVRRAEPASNVPADSGKRASRKQPTNPARGRC